MDIVRVSGKRAGSLLAAGVLMLATMLPALVSAATVTSRYVQLSSSVRGASGVTAEIGFTAATNGTGAAVVEFCTTPEVGTACTQPTGLVIGAAPDDDTDHTVTELVTDQALKVVLDAPVNGGSPVTIGVKDLTNPSSGDVFYARIVTYADGDTEGNFNYTDAEDLGEYLDSGSVGITLTDGFDVSGTVLETLTFCVSGPNELGENPLVDDCSAAEEADIVLGDEEGVLTTQLSTGTVHTLLSTNSNGGAVVRLKSNAAGCGGLLREGTGSASQRCGITPLTTPGSIGDGTAKFGVILDNLSATTGTINAAGSYSEADYYMGFDAVDESEGVTSPYGDPVFNTNGAPVNGGKADLTFGANISDVTPAGKYSASFSLVATGTY